MERLVRGGGSGTLWLLTRNSVRGTVHAVAFGFGYSGIGAKVYLYLALSLPRKARATSEALHAVNLQFISYLAGGLLHRSDFLPAHERIPFVEASCARRLGWPGMVWRYDLFVLF